MVAVVWQDFLARCYPSVLMPAGRLVLFLSVWGIYIADRMVDVRDPMHEINPCVTASIDSMTFAAVLLGLVALADFLAVRLWLRPAVMRNGLIVAALVVLYMAIFPSRRTRHMRWKQPSAAALFTMGVFLVAWTGTPDAWRTLGAPACGLRRVVSGKYATDRTCRARAEPRPDTDPGVRVPRGRTLLVVDCRRCQCGGIGRGGLSGLSMVARNSLPAGRSGALHPVTAALREPDANRSFRAVVPVGRVRRLRTRP